MAELHPPARVVDRPPEPDWLGAALLVLVTVGVPIALHVGAPASNVWMRWAFHVVPLVAVGVAIGLALRAGESPWIVVRDPARRPDARRWVYVGFDVAFVAGYLIAFKHAVPNRHGWAMVALEILPLGAWLMATGTLLARRWSWWLVVAGGAVMLIWMIAMLSVLLYTASYLSGVYGAFGRGAAAGVMGIAVMLIQFVALLPAFQLKWIMTRAGRRRFGLRPLWPAPARRGDAPPVGAAA